MNDTIQMFVAGLVLDPASNAPIVILKDDSGEKALPIWIGLAEATAIASCLKKLQLARPMTHDLLSTVIEDLGASIVRVVVSGIRENTFIAELEVVQGDVLRTLDCRPSDGIALAVRCNAPIFVAKAVLDTAQVTIREAQPDGPPGEEGEETENFANIDKEKWSQILSAMDPDDFKYKM